MLKSSLISRYVPLLSGILFLSVWAYACWFDPQNGWGLHFARYLSPVPLTLTLILAGGAAALLGISRHPIQLPVTGWRNGILLLTLLFLTCAFHLLMPIQTDIYGDHRYMLSKSMSHPAKLHLAELWQRALTLNLFSSKNGEHLVINGVELMHRYTGLGYPASFRLWNAASGCLFWLAYFPAITLMLGKRPALRIAFLVIGMLSGFTLFFHGYAEVYAISMAGFWFYILRILHYFRKPGRRNLVWATLALVLAIKCNSAGWLFLLSWILLLVHHLHGMQTLRTPVYKWAWISLTTGAAGGLYVYAEVFHKWRGSHINSITADPIREMFLPMINDHRHFASYTLLGSAHVLDFLNLILFFSFGGVFLLLIGTTFLRRNLIRQPQVIIPLANFAVFIAFYFMFDPALTMVRDWDLMSLLTPALLWMAAVLAQQIPQPAQARTAGWVVGLTLLQLPVFLVHANRDALTLRLEDAGKHVYKTYWGGSSYLLNVTLRMDEKDPEKYLRRRLALLEELQPYACLGRDDQFADLVSRVGEHYYKTGQFQKSGDYYVQALAYSPQQHYYHLAAVSYLRASNYRKAKTYCDLLLQQNESVMYLRLSIQIELGLRNWADCLKKCDIYLRKQPGDKAIYDLRQQLYAMNMHHER